MNILEQALALAEMGFYVFPIKEGVKSPPLVSHKQESSRDPKQIEVWWRGPILEEIRPYNIGISTHRYRDTEALVCIDIDPKKGGFGTEADLLLDGKAFPPTLTQITPSGGRHYLYTVPKPLRQGVDVFGPGIDVRSGGGYIVGCGSTLLAGRYSFSSEGGSIPKECPEWVRRELESVEDVEPVEAPEGIDAGYAKERAAFYLAHTAKPAVAFEGGNARTFSVAACIKDLGVDSVTAKQLMAEVYNPRCVPPWSEDEIYTITEHAYRHGKQPIGVLAPNFPPIVDSAPVEVLHPLDEISKYHAFIIVKGKHCIIYERADARGKKELEFMEETSFHKKFASKKMQIPCAKGFKEELVTKVWMNGDKRRDYSEGLCFLPGIEAPKGFYNLWRGFNFAPSDKGTGADHEAVQAFLEHARENVCGGDSELFRWLIGYFAHLVQKPGEKPLTALVFKGDKGVGKSSLINVIGELLGNHYKSASNQRYLTGNFNSHLENCLLMTLEEAFWSGEKSAHGVLKSLITEKHLMIERKGLEAYSIENFTRYCIIGNEEWLIPASDDERRYAVFLVGHGRKQDLGFFEGMRLGMEAGGYSHLLRYLLDFDLTGINLNSAPKTQGLLDQKMHSLDYFGQWWNDCLLDGKILGAEDEWPQLMTRERLCDSLYAFCDKRNMARGWRISPVEVGDKIRSACPSATSSRRLLEGERRRVLMLPSLSECRLAWETKMGHKIDWEDDFEDEREAQGE